MNNGNVKLNKRVDFFVESAIYDKLKQNAQDSHLTVSELIRNLIAKGIYEENGIKKLTADFSLLNKNMENAVVSLEKRLIAMEENFTQMNVKLTQLYAMNQAVIQKLTPKKP
jgi:hypothetical protein